MNHEVTEEGKAIVVALEGDVDLSSSPDARKAGCEFALAAVSEPALRVLRLARLDTVFTIHESREAALAEIG